MQGITAIPSLTTAFLTAAVIGVFVNGCVAGLYALTAVAYDTSEGLYITVGGVFVATALLLWVVRRAPAASRGPEAVPTDRGSVRSSGLG